MAELSQLGKEQAEHELGAARAATYDVDDALIRLVGNLTLRDVQLTQAERALLEVAVMRLGYARKFLDSIEASEPH